MGVIICGPTSTPDGPQCPCCKEVFSDPEAMATSMCWGCAFGNPNCARCREDGVPGTRFRSRRGRVHRIVQGEPLYRSACGQTFTGDTLTGPGDRPNCRHCWGAD